MSKIIAITALCIAALLLAGCKPRPDWPTETTISSPITITPPSDADAMLIQRLENQKWAKPVKKFSDYEGVIDGDGLPVPKENLGSGATCIHDMPLDWTCTLCPKSQRIWKESCPVQ